MFGIQIEMQTKSPFYFPLRGWIKESSTQAIQLTFDVVVTAHQFDVFVDSIAGYGSLFVGGEAGEWRNADGGYVAHPIFPSLGPNGLSPIFGMVEW